MYADGTEQIEITFRITSISDTLILMQNVDGRLFAPSRRDGSTDLLEQLCPAVTD